MKRLPLLLACAVASCGPDITCGAGTTKVDGECVAPTYICGAGTRREDGLCVVECPAGSEARDGACHPTELPCGPGTRAEDGECVADLACGEETRLVEGQCVPLEASLSCAPGTYEDEGVCMADGRCGPGTREEAGLCVSESSEVVCGEGTREIFGVCLPIGEVICGEGTHAVGTQCRVLVEPRRCGEGTERQNGRCVPSPVQRRCGRGTREVDGECIADPPPRECGPGTREVEGECRPVDDWSDCGDGTHIVDDRCVPDVVCGPGTRAVEGLCEAHRDCPEGEALSDDGVCQPVGCGRGTVERGGRCVGLAVQRLALPFREGLQVRVSQGANGEFSHSGRGLHALDFNVLIDTPVVAAKSGTVLFVKEDSLEGCGEPRCAPLANYVVIDHGDGTRASYLHLRFRSARVEPGDSVCAGEQIGRAGATGFATGPHLHLEVREPLGHSLPLRFPEFDAVSDGEALPELGVRSTTEEPEGCEPVPPSTCPAELLVHRGVLLEPGFPCAVAELDREYHLRGRVLTGQPRLRLSRRPAGGAWQELCVDTQADGAFDVPVVWGSDEYESAAEFMVSAADAGVEDCRSFQGWERSLSLWLR